MQGLKILGRDEDQNHGLKFLLTRSNLLYYQVCRSRIVNSQEQEKVLHSVMLIIDLHIEHVSGSASVLSWAL